MSEDDELKSQMLLGQFSAAHFSTLTAETRFEGSVVDVGDGPSTSALKPEKIKPARTRFVHNKQLDPDPSTWTIEEHVGVSQLARLDVINPEAVNSLCRSLLPFYEPESVLRAVENYKRS